MRVRLVRHNDLLYLPLDGSILAGLGIDAGAVLELTVEGHRLIVSLINPGEREDEDQLLEKIERDYDSMFKRLSE